MSERGSKLVGDTPRFAEFKHFSGTHGHDYLLPIGEGTDEQTLPFVSWLLIRIELLALLMQTVVAYCRHVDPSKVCWTALPRLIRGGGGILMPGTLRNCLCGFAPPLTAVVSSCLRTHASS